VVLIPVAVLLLMRLLIYRNDFKILLIHFVVFVQVICFATDRPEGLDWNVTFIPSFILLGAQLIRELQILMDLIQNHETSGKPGDEIFTILDISCVALFSLALYLFCEVLNLNYEYEPAAVYVSATALIVLTLT
jgi:peptidoglycan/LPS O-acetylase OafA/YrhL